MTSKVMIKPPHKAEDTEVSTSRAFKQVRNLQIAAKNTFTQEGEADYIDLKAADTKTVSLQLAKDQLDSILENESKFSPDKFLLAKQLAERNVATANQAHRDRKSSIFSFFMASLSKESISLLEEKELAAWITAQQDFDLHLFLAILTSTHSGLSELTQSDARNFARNRLLHASHRQGDEKLLKLHNEEFEESANLYMSLLTEAEKESVSLKNDLKDIYFKTLNEDFLYFQSSPEFLMAADFEEASEAALAWYAKKYKEIVVGLGKVYKRIRDSYPAPSIDKRKEKFLSKDTQDKALVALDRSKTGPKNKPKSSKDSFKEASKAFDKKPPLVNNPSSPTAYTKSAMNKQKFKGSKSHMEGEAKVKVEFADGGDCKYCAKNIRDGVSRNYVIRHKTADCRKQVKANQPKPTVNFAVDDWDDEEGSLAFLAREDDSDLHDMTPPIASFPIIREFTTNQLRAHSKYLRSLRPLIPMRVRLARYRRLLRFLHKHIPGLVCFRRRTKRSPPILCFRPFHSIFNSLAFNRDVTLPDFQASVVLPPDPPRHDISVPSFAADDDVVPDLLDDDDKSRVPGLISDDSDDSDDDSDSVPDLISDNSPSSDYDDDTNTDQDGVPDLISEDSDESDDDSDEVPDLISDDSDAVNEDSKFTDDDNSSDEDEYFNLHFPRSYGLYTLRFRYGSSFLARDESEQPEPPVSSHNSSPVSSSVASPDQKRVAVEREIIQITEDEDDSAIADDFNYSHDDTLQMSSPSDLFQKATSSSYCIGLAKETAQKSLPKGCDSSILDLLPDPTLDEWSCPRCTVVYSSTVSSCDECDVRKPRQPRANRSNLRNTRFGDFYKPTQASVVISSPVASAFFKSSCAKVARHRKEAAQASSSPKKVTVLSNVAGISKIPKIPKQLLQARSNTSQPSASSAIPLPDVSFHAPTPISRTVPPVSFASGQHPLGAVHIFRHITSDELTIGQVGQWLNAVEDNDPTQMLLPVYQDVQAAYKLLRKHFRHQQSGIILHPNVPFIDPDDDHAFATQDTPMEFDDLVFILDTGCSRHLFNSSLLVDSRDVIPLTAPRAIHGIGGGTVSITHTGSYGPFVRVAYSDDPQQYNLVSLAALLNDGYSMSWRDWDQCFVFHKLGVPDFNIVFQRDHRFWIFRPNAPRDVAMSARPFTLLERQQAVEARRYHELSGHRGRNEEELSLRRGSIQGCTVTGQHLRLADQLLGPCPVCIKAKAHRPTLTARTRIPTDQIGHTQHVDVFFLRLRTGVLLPTFIFVDEASNCVQIYHPPGGKRTNFELGVRQINGFYLHYRHSSVRLIFSDNEGSVHKFEETFRANGGQIIFKAAGDHVGLAERYICVLKEITRVILFSLPYTFPAHLLSFLIDEAAQLLSMRSNPKTQGVPVCELVMSQRPDLLRLQISFGSYGQVVNAHTGALEVGIVIKRPLWGEYNFKLMLLPTKELVTRRGLTPLPLTPDVIATLNALTAPIQGDYVDVSIRGSSTPDESPVATSPDAPVEPPSQEHFPDSLILPAAGSELVPELEPTPDLSPSSTIASNVSAPVLASPPVLFDSVAPDESSPIDVSVPLSPDIPVAPLAPTTRVRVTPPPAALRRSTRVRSIPAKLRAALLAAEFFKDPELSLAFLADSVDYCFKVLDDKDKNLSIKKASAQYADIATDALKKELQQFIDKDTFHPIKWSSLSPDMKACVIRSFTFAKPKRDVHGALERLKARLVAGGHMVDTDQLGDISSPTCKTETLFLLFALAAWKGWDLSCMDVPGAYLNTRLPTSQRIPMIIGREETAVLILLQPSWAPFVNPDGTLLVMVTGGLYGLPQSALLWYERLKLLMTDLGYVATSMDPACFVKYFDDGHISIAIVHVDDVAHFHTGAGDQDALFLALSNAFTPPTLQQGPTGIFVGIEYSFDRIQKSVELTMLKYSNKLLEDLQVVKTSLTPADANFMSVDDSSPSTDQRVFASVVMSVYYLAMRTRPDLLIYMTVLATRIKDARVSDMAKLQRVLAYLNRTRTLGIVLRIDGTVVQFSVDASYALHSNARSHSGLHITLGNGTLPARGYGGPIVVRSHVQRLVACSSFEAEINAVHQYRHYYVMFRSLLADFGFDQSSPSIIFQDNEASILVLNRGPTTSGRTKFIDVRVFHITDCIREGLYQLVYCPTDDMPADPATKPLHSRSDMLKLLRLLNVFRDAFQP